MLHRRCNRCEGLRSEGLRRGEARAGGVGTVAWTWPEQGGARGRGGAEQQGVGGAENVGACGTVGLSMVGPAPGRARLESATGSVGCPGRVAGPASPRCQVVAGGQGVGVVGAEHPQLVGEQFLHGGCRPGLITGTRTSMITCVPDIQAGVLIPLPGRRRLGSGRPGRELPIHHTLHGPKPSVPHPTPYHTGPPHRCSRAR